MFRQKSIVTLLGPADPARDVPVPPRRHTAQDLIQRAEARPETVPAEVGTPVTAGHRRPTLWAGSPRRRLSLAAGAATAVAVAAALAVSVLTPTEPNPSQPGPVAPGTVVVPIAYEVVTDPPPAADRLRALAATLTEAPYEQSSGRYAYHRHRSWGDATQRSPEGYLMSYVEEMERWTGADGTTVGRHTIDGVEFPNEESRQYWQEIIDAEGVPGLGNSVDLLQDIMLPNEAAPLPDDRAGLVARLRAAEGPVYLIKPLVTTFGYHLVPRPVRAQILEILADTPGFAWRGEVTDRSGRSGVAISYDDTAHAQQHVLVFDPETGVLLAQEMVSLVADPQVALYSMLEYGHADERPEVDGINPVVPSPAG